MYSYKSFYVFAVLLLSLQNINAVTVKPVKCPSNKIAPHKKVQNWNYRGRTFGHFYSLFSDDNVVQGGQSDLQEQPQADDPDDCGEIEDYDETDVSPGTNSQRRSDQENRLFLNWFNGNNDGDNPSKPQRPPFFPNDRPPVTSPSVYPTRPTRPMYSPIRPTYSPSRPPSGGFFANNNYRPPIHNSPTDAIKPVFENGVEPALQWQPGVIGGQLGHIVGVPVRPPRPTFGSNPTYPVTPVRPSNRPQAQTNNRPEESQNDANRKPSPRHINNNNSIIGSFFDLFSK